MATEREQRASDARAIEVAVEVMNRHGLWPEISSCLNQWAKKHVKLPRFKRSLDSDCVIIEFNNEERGHTATDAWAFEQVKELLEEFATVQTTERDFLSLSARVSNACRTAGIGQRKSAQD